MSWVRIDDQFHAHPKVASMGERMLPAVGLHTLALSWSASTLTDGFIPSYQTARLAGRNVDDLVDALVSVGMWEPEDGGFRIHDYLDYNPSKEEVLSQREHVSQARSEAGKRGAESRWRARDNEDNGKNGKPMANGMANGWPRPRTHIDNNIVTIFEYWRTVMNKDARTHLDGKREKAIQRGLAVLSEDECKRAIDGCALTPWNMGINPTGKRYDALSLIFRDAEHWEGFIEVATKHQTDQDAEELECPTITAADYARVMGA